MVLCTFFLVTATLYEKWWSWTYECCHGNNRTHWLYVYLFISRSPLWRKSCCETQDVEYCINWEMYTLYVGGDGNVDTYQWQDYSGKIEIISLVVMFCSSIMSSLSFTCCLSINEAGSSDILSFKLNEINATKAFNYSEMRLTEI